MCKQIINSKINFFNKIHHVNQVFKYWIFNIGFNYHLNKSARKMAKNKERNNIENIQQGSGKINLS